MFIIRQTRKNSGNVACTRTVLDWCGVSTSKKDIRAELYCHVVLFAWLPFLREREYWPRRQ